MEKTARLDMLARAYIIAASIIFLLVTAMYWMMLAETDVKHYCTHVPATEPHDFKVGENNACLINWSVILEKGWLPMLILILVFYTPALILYGLSRKKRSNYADAAIPKKKMRLLAAVCLFLALMITLIVGLYDTALPTFFGQTQDVTFTNIAIILLTLSGCIWLLQKVITV